MTAAIVLHKCVVSTQVRCVAGNKRVTAAIVLRKCDVSTQVCCVAGNKRVRITIVLRKSVVLTQVCCVTGNKRVTAAIAFSLALFSHVLNHVVMRLQATLCELENPSRLGQSDSPGENTVFPAPSPSQPPHTQVNALLHPLPSLPIKKTG